MPNNNATRKMSAKEKYEAAKAKKNAERATRKASPPRRTANEARAATAERFAKEEARRKEIAKEERRRKRQGTSHVGLNRSGSVERERELNKRTRGF